MSEKMELAEAGLRHADGLTAQLNIPHWVPSRAHIEQARNSIKKLAEMIRASSPAQEPVTTEPVALDRATKRAMFAQEDDRALPAHGQIPWKQLGRDVRDVMFGTRSDYPFDETYYPGHQTVPSMNFNSLARIVDKYRWEGIAIPAPPQPEREVLRKLVDIVWNEATESKAVPSTKWADRLIDRALIGEPK